MLYTSCIFLQTKNKLRTNEAGNVKNLRTANLKLKFTDSYKQKNLRHIIIADVP